MIGSGVGNDGVHVRAGDPQHGRHSSAAGNIPDPVRTLR
jgi:hypothetical protein